MELQQNNELGFRFRLVSEVIGEKHLDPDELDIASLDEVLGELMPLERQIIALRLEARLPFSKIGRTVGLKDHVARRVYQTALTKLRYRERLHRILAAVTPSWRLLQLIPRRSSGLR